MSVVERQVTISQPLASPNRNDPETADETSMNCIFLWSDDESSNFGVSCGGGGKAPVKMLRFSKSATNPQVLQLWLDSFKNFVLLFSFPIQK